LDRADQILGCHRADTALSAVRAAASGCESGGDQDPCLCHGAAGLGDALLTCGDACAAAALGRRIRVQGPPGLLPGRAGIGLFCLRLADRRVPGVLAIGGLDASVTPSIASSQHATP
jgi:hypothetical protein